MSAFYLIATVIGLVVPGFFVGQFVALHGLNLGLLLSDSFSNPAAAAFTTDVLVSSVVFWIFAYTEARRHQIGKWWLCILGNLIFGLSFGLPLFLYLRQRKLDRK